MKQQFSIQKFTAAKSGTPINVKLDDIFAIHPNDGTVPSGATYADAGALIVTTAGYYLPVKEGVSEATELWLNGLNKMAGTA